MAMRSVETDYLVVGAGAMGMAFTDALIDHADVHVTIVDRRHTASGHWQDAYPFVQLHQASLFYGVASTVLGSGAVQQHGPESGLQERAHQPEIQAYYDDILRRRFAGTGRVTFLGGHEYHTDGSSQLATSLLSGESRLVPQAILQPRKPLRASRSTSSHVQLVRARYSSRKAWSSCRSRVRAMRTLGILGGGLWGRSSGDSSP